MPWILSICRKFDLHWFPVKYYKHAGKNKHYSHKFRKGLVVGFNDLQAFLLSARELFIEEIISFAAHPIHQELLTAVLILA
jgi:hypothetical protein